MYDTKISLSVSSRTYTILSEISNYKTRRSVMALGVKLKELRLEKGDSLQEVADAVDVSKTHIWELERGTSKNPSLNLVKKLADYFGQSIDYLTGEDEEKSSSALNFARKINGMNLSDTDREALLAAAEILNKKK